jgi:hypothetical protein
MVEFPEQNEFSSCCQLAFPGVTIESFDIDKLITYFDYFDIDLDNVVSVKAEEDGQFIDYRARQTRLNHKPFTYKIDVTSDKAADAYVRVFLGPKYDDLGREFNINDRRHYFVEIDRFPYKGTQLVLTRRLLNDDISIGLSSG